MVANVNPSRMIKVAGASFLSKTAELYRTLVKDPVLIAIFSVLITYGFTELVGYYSQESSRNQSLKLLEFGLKENRDFFEGLLRDSTDEFTGTAITFSYGNFATTNYIQQFLQSKYWDISRDSELLRHLNGHIANLESIRNFQENINRVYTSDEREYIVHLGRKLKNERNQAIKKSLMARLDSCIMETKAKL